MGKDEARDAVGDYRYGFHDPENAVIKFDKGISEQVVRDISALKNEPEWMTEIRVKAYHHYVERPMPDWGNMGLLNSIDFDAVTYFLKSSSGTAKDWDDVPEDIKHTFDRLGIPDAEQKWLGGVTAQYESEAVYHSIREDLEKQGVLFYDMDSGLREHEDIVREYFCSVIPYTDNKFSAL
ncbi:MAG: Fe-S cluster assembly protein SufB, partial [Pseudomonadales bacterium]|nr:Fe-S cluster assembly protein SufB [Pseudomonadales bacterium]